MPIEERGYKPYDGPRLGSARNQWVVARMEAWRIWASPLVKIVLILSLLPPAGFTVYEVAYAKLFAPGLAGMARATGEQVDEGRVLADALDAEIIVKAMNTQLVFAILMTLAWGSATIASDARSRTLQFYFAKPVVPTSYMVGKTVPVAVYSAVICLLPAVLLVPLEAVVLRTHGLLWARLALLLPALLYAAVIGLSLAICSVAASSLSQSRLLTLSMWGAVLFVPMAVAWIVKLSTHGEVQWPYLASIVSMLRLLGRAIFRLEVEGQIQWYHAVAVVAALCVGAVFLLRHRLSRPEVVG